MFDYQSSLIPTFNFSTGVRRHIFKLPAYGPRPSSVEFVDALSAQSTSKCGVDVLPTKLRPVKIEDAILCCKIKLCSEQKLLYFVNAQLLVLM
jgi:hypothetical protein